MSLQQFNHLGSTEPKPSPTLKEGTPTRVLLRKLTILNTGESKNLRIILPEMARIGIGVPIKIWKGNLIECT